VQSSRGPPPPHGTTPSPPNRPLTYSTHSSVPSSCHTPESVPPPPPQAPATFTHIVRQTPYRASFCIPNRTFQLSSDGEHVANPLPTRLCTPYPCITKDFLEILAHCQTSFPRSYPHQMIPFQLVGAKTQTQVPLCRIASVQSARGPEMPTMI
jgi:hypothetical protein